MRKAMAQSVPNKDRKEVKLGAKGNKELIKKVLSNGGSHIIINVTLLVQESPIKTVQKRESLEILLMIIRTAVTAAQKSPSHAITHQVHSMPV